MKYVLSAIPALWRAQLATMIQYRGEIALWALWGIIFPAVSLAMWSAATGDGAAGGPGTAAVTIRGFSRGDFAAYFLLTMVASHFAAAWDIFEMAWAVRSGRMSPALLRPILPMWESVAANIAYKVTTLAILLPLWGLIAWLVKPTFATDAAHIALGVPAMLLGATLNYLCGYTLALLAFWTTKTEAAGEFWFGGSLLFGGRIAPLALLPVPLQWVAAVLPFKWVVWFPSEVLIGRLPLTQVVGGLACQVVWIVGLVLLFRVLWRAALKRYTAVGA